MTLGYNFEHRAAAASLTQLQWVSPGGQVALKANVQESKGLNHHPATDTGG